MIEYYNAKSLIRTSNPGLFSWSEAYLNPYQGCYHDCKYCDGKSEGYYMHKDFAERIKVKVNAPQLLEQYLRKNKFIPLRREKTSTLLDFAPGLKEQVTQPAKFILFIGGGVCDVYQPAERETQMTRTLLGIAHDYKFPVCILTKNTLVLRDLDLLKKINKDSYACCSFTITLKGDTQKIFEPNASTTKERFEAVKTLRDNGIHAGVYFYPVLPFIGDTNENMQGIYATAKKVKAEFVYCWGLTLKPGRSKQEFLYTVKKHFPSLLPKYKKLYGNNHTYGHCDVDQFKKMGLEYPEIKGYRIGYQLQMPYTAERFIPEGRIATNLKIAEVLLKMAYIKGYILQESQTRSLYEAAHFLEEYQKDLGLLTSAAVKRLPPTKEVHEYINEFVSTKSKHLEELEKTAYRTISAKN